MSYIAWISDSALWNLRAEAKEAHPYETGGSLIGWMNGTEYVVTTMVGPGPKAEHSRYRFRPDGEYRTAIIEDHFRNTGGRETYLGDWHTHPGQAVPAMSWLDRRELGRIARHAEAQISEPIMAILGGIELESGESPCLCVWRGTIQRVLYFRYFKTNNLLVRSYHISKNV